MTTRNILKNDIFGEVRRESGRDGDIIVRDSSKARPWCRWLARRLLRREARALARLRGARGFPQLLRHGRNALVRHYVAGQPLHVARATDPAYYRAAMQLVRQLHCRGIVHNDLAKEPNLLVDDDGGPVLLDFQLAWVSRRRSALFRALAYDDVRHLLKHKQNYCPQALTTRERRILGRRSWPARIWRRTVKPLYRLTTRGLLGWSDREGAGERGGGG